MPSWPRRWPSSPTSTRWSGRGRVSRWTGRVSRDLCVDRARSPPSRVSDAERTHLGGRIFLPGGPPDLLVAQCREHVVHHDGADGHADVAGAHLDMLGGRVETGPPVDDA